MVHKILSLHNTCTGCFACANACPKDAISLPSGFEGFYYPKIDEEKCINCQLCDKICPVLNPIKTSIMSHAYYGWSKNDSIRKASSSGGLFYHLASIVLDDGGIVYGASFDYGDTIRLSCHSTKEVHLKELMKSKYIQSYIGYAYRDIKNDLGAGYLVLFCGTPCQVSGLKSFLCKDYDNLITIDFVCHGVPSMDLFIKHLEYLNISHVVDVNFRPKNTAWYDDFEIRYKQSSLSKRTVLRKIPWTFDEFFYKLYAKNYSIRRSCQKCSYCNGQRPGDITIADFWGVKNYRPELWDSKGISMILAINSRGLYLINRLQKVEGCFIEEMPTYYAEYAFSHKRTDKTSEFQLSDRDAFLKDVYSIGYRQSLVKYGLRTRKIDYLLFRIKRMMLYIYRKLYVKSKI